MFAELLKQVIAEAEAMFDHPLKQYALFKEFEEKLKARETPGVPDAFGDNRHAQAYYGAIRLVLGEEAFAAMDEKLRDVFQDISFNSNKLGDEQQKNDILRHLLEDFAKPELNLRPSRVGQLDIIGNRASADVYGRLAIPLLSGSIRTRRPQSDVHPRALGQGNKGIEAETLGALLVQVHGARMRDAQLFRYLFVA